MSSTIERIWTDGISSADISDVAVAAMRREVLHGIYPVDSQNVYNILVLPDRPSTSPGPGVPNPPDVPGGIVPPVWGTSGAGSYCEDTIMFVCDRGFILGSHTKQPRDRVRFTVDYSRWLRNGETLTSASTEVDNDDLVVSAAFIDPNSGGTQVIFFVSAGLDGGDYKVTVTAETADQRVERELYIDVEEV